MIDIERSEAWVAFLEMRAAKGKRAPFTPLARKRILFELRRFEADGQDVEEILWTSVTNGWSGVFPIRRRGWTPQEVPMTVPTRAPAQTAAYLESQRQTPEQRAASDAARRETMAKLRKVA